MPVLFCDMRRRSRRQQRSSANWEIFSATDGCPQCLGKEICLSCFIFILFAVCTFGTRVRFEIMFAMSLPPASSYATAPSLPLQKVCQCKRMSLLRPCLVFSQNPSLPFSIKTTDKEMAASPFDTTPLPKRYPGRHRDPCRISMCPVSG